ncbi:hypothetical protein FMN50_08350 [Rhodobacterales bacterium]|nr:hypothetical protein FMN50_08350 [Rhodobacterales bacterium]
MAARKQTTAQQKAAAETQAEKDSDPGGSAPQGAPETPPRPTAVRVGGEQKAPPRVVRGKGPSKVTAIPSDDREGNGAGTPHQIAPAARGGAVMAPDAVAEINGRLDTLTETVATFEAYFAITLMSRLDALVEEKVRAAEQSRRHLRLGPILVLSLLVNVGLLALYLDPDLPQRLGTWATWGIDLVHRAVDGLMGLFNSMTR